MSAAQARAGWPGGVAHLAAAVLVAGAIVGAGPRLMAMSVLPRLASAPPPVVEGVFTIVIFGLLALAGVIGARVDGRSALAPGRRAGVSLGGGLALGLGALLAAAAYAALAGTLAPGTGEATPRTWLLAGLAVVAVQAGAEEVFFRGWLQPALVRRWGAAPGLGVTALAFGVLHLSQGWLSPVATLNMVLGGVIFGWLAWRTGGIAAAAGMHIAYNAAEQLLLGLDPNPGVGAFGALFERDLAGRALWGGSAEGLNGSLGTSVALLAVLVPLAIARRGREPRVAVA